MKSSITVLLLAATVAASALAQAPFPGQPPFPGQGQSLPRVNAPAPPDEEECTRGGWAGTVNRYDPRTGERSKTIIVGGCYLEKVAEALFKGGPWPGRGAGTEELWETLDSGRSLLDPYSEDLRILEANLEMLRDERPLIVESGSEEAIDSHNTLIEGMTGNIELRLMRLEESLARLIEMEEGIYVVRMDEAERETLLRDSNLLIDALVSLRQALEAVMGQLRGVRIQPG